MKKIFLKLENKNDEKGAATFVTNYTGKVFQINKHSVVVEEILAEGKTSWQKKVEFLWPRFSESIFSFLIKPNRRFCDCVPCEGQQ